VLSLQSSACVLLEQCKTIRMCVGGYDEECGGEGEMGVEGGVCDSRLNGRVSEEMAAGT